MILTFRESLRKETKRGPSETSSYSTSKMIIKRLLWFFSLKKQ